MKIKSIGHLVKANPIQSQSKPISLPRFDDILIEGCRIGHTQADFDPRPLKPLTTYYWRIDENDAAGTVTGKLWSSTTGAVPPATAM